MKRIKIGCLKEGNRKSRYPLTTIVCLAIFLMTALFGTLGCSSSKSQTVRHIGTKRGCEIKYRKLGYQRWQADKLCKRYHH